MVTLAELFPDVDWFSMKGFEPCAWYSKELDWLYWLDEDVAYCAVPTYPAGLDILMHEGRCVGFKVMDLTGLLAKAGLKAVPKDE